MKSEYFHTIFGTMSMLILLLLTSESVNGQIPGCTYDKSNPQLKSAESSLKAREFECAKLELSDLLASPSIPDETKAKAHILMARIYYMSVQDWATYRDSILSEFYNAIDKGRGGVGKAPEEVRNYPDLVSLFDSAYADWMTKRDNQDKEKCFRYDRSVSKNNKLRLFTGIGCVGAATGALLFHTKANSAYDDYMEKVDPTDISSAWDDYESKVHMRNYLIGAASVLAIAELWLNIKKPHKPDVDCSQFQNEKKAIAITYDPFSSKVVLTWHIPGL